MKIIILEKESSVVVLAKPSIKNKLIRIYNRSNSTAHYYNYRILCEVLNKKEYPNLKNTITATNYYRFVYTDDKFRICYGREREL